jgi:hypothetical protein
VSRVSIGTQPGSCVVLDVQERRFPESSNYWDVNLLLVIVAVEAGPWRGRFEAGISTEEFQVLLHGIRGLFQNLDGTAKLEPPWNAAIRLHFRGNGLGHIEVLGDAIDPANQWDRLSFRLALDQTELPALVKELELVTSEFPVLGEPSSSIGVEHEL